MFNVTSPVAAKGADVGDAAAAASALGVHGVAEQGFSSWGRPPGRVLPSGDKWIYIYIYISGIEVFELCLNYGLAMASRWFGRLELCLNYV